MFVAAGVGRTPVQRLVAHRQIGDSHRAAPLDRHALDQVAEFTHIAGPAGGLQGFDRCARELHPRAASGADAMRQIGDQQRQILAAIAQRRHVDRHHVEPIEQIRAKRACDNGLFKIVMGRGDDAHITAVQT